MILLARETDNALLGQPLLAAMNVRVRRNAFGSQRESFETALHIPTLGDQPYHAVFIRAPWVRETGPGVRSVWFPGDTEIEKSGGGAAWTTRVTVAV